MWISLEPVTRERRIELTKDLDQAGSMNTDYLVLVALSCAIATFGLIQNSAAVIIGAMLIAPIMSPISRASLAVIRGDLPRVWRAFGTLSAGAFLAIVLSAVFGLLTSSSAANLQEQLPSEILVRTQPNLFDLVVALAGGAAVAYALARKELSATLPGVAIATALMPPLCTLGLGIALGRSDVSLGAFLLFIVNLSAIVLTSSLVFVLLGFRPLDVRRTRLPLWQVFAIEAGVLIVILIPITQITVNVLHQARENQIVRSTLNTELAKNKGATLADFQLTHETGYIEIVATIRTSHELSYPVAVAIQKELALRLQETVALKLLEVPITVLDPLVPPTPTPTATPEPTATPTVTPTPTATPVNSPPAATSTP